QAQRGATPAPPLPPPVAPRLLHGRLLEPQNRRPITRVLCAQAIRAATPYPSDDRASSPPRGRTVGPATRQPHLATPATNTAARYRRLTRSLRSIRGQPQFPGQGGNRGHGFSTH